MPGIAPISKHRCPIALTILVMIAAVLNAQEGPPLPPQVSPLRSGDTIALVCPASPLSQEAVQRGKSYLEALGYRVKLGQSLTNPFLCDLAGTDQQRLDDFNGFLRDPEVNAIMALRGGYGSPRLLDRLDYSALLERPKIITGFSDVTAIHMAVLSQTGMISFHSPVIGFGFGTKSMREFTARSFWSMLEGRVAPGMATFVGAADWSEQSKLHTMVAGQAEGILVGGNLSIVAALEGTPYALPRDRDLILFLEEVDEPAYRVDRMLTQLRLAGAMQSVRGVVIGDFTAPNGKPEESPMIAGVLRDCFAALNVPVLQGVPIGHLQYNMTVAHGARIKLDATAQQLIYLDPIFTERP